MKNKKGGIDLHVMSQHDAFALTRNVTHMKTAKYSRISSLIVTTTPFCCIAVLKL